MMVKARFIILRFKNAPYTFSVGNILETRKIQLKSKFIFPKAANPAKSSSKFFKTQLTQLNPVAVMSEYNQFFIVFASSNYHFKVPLTGPVC